jgi:hypothetical protein
MTTAILVYVLVGAVVALCLSIAGPLTVFDRLTICLLWPCIAWTLANYAVKRLKEKHVG